MRFSRIITTVDAHTAGEPVRVITSGLPEIPGATMLEKMDWFKNNLGGLRNLLMREPRGHRDMFGVVLTPPVTEDGDIGILYMHTTDMATMCGHLTIGTVKVLLETGMLLSVEGENIVRLDTPAGRVEANALVKNGAVTEVSFRNVPSFVYEDGIKAAVPDIGEISVAVSYGGDFYIFVEVRDLGIRVSPEFVSELDKYAVWFKEWGNSELKIVHPEVPEINEIYGVVFTDDVEKTSNGWKSTETASCHPRAIDRSPCGTGTSARMALMYSRGLMTQNQQLESYSIIGTRFVGTIESITSVGGKTAIIPRISGQAWITGFNHLVIDPDDPLQEGFLI